MCQGWGFAIARSFCYSIFAISNLLGYLMFLLQHISFAIANLLQHIYYNGFAKVFDVFAIADRFCYSKFAIANLLEKLFCYSKNHFGCFASKNHFAIANLLGSKICQQNNQNLQILLAKLFCQQICQENCFASKFARKSVLLQQILLQQIYQEPLLAKQFCYSKFCYSKFARKQKLLENTYCSQNAYCFASQKICQQNLSILIVFLAKIILLQQILLQQICQEAKFARKLANLQAKSMIFDCFASKLASGSYFLANFGPQQICYSKICYSKTLLVAN